MCILQSNTRSRHLNININQLNAPEKHSNILFETNENRTKENRITVFSDLLFGVKCVMTLVDCELLCERIKMV